VQKTFSVKEVAEMVGVSERWLADTCRAEAVTHVHIARRRRFTAEQVDLLLKSFTVRPEQAVRIDAERERVLRRLRTAAVKRVS
jgi:hypothetical protein